MAEAAEGPGRTYPRGDPRDRRLRADAVEAVGDGEPAGRFGAGVVQPHISAQARIPRYVPVFTGRSYEVQCLKCRVPVNTIATLCSSAALITSASRIEPPGWITAVAPASIATSKPSGNGKNAAEATTEPLVRGADNFNSFAASSALRAAMRAASTRLICPAPMPTVARFLAYTIVFDFTCLATRNAKRRSANSASLGARLVTVFICISSITALSRDCTSRPPATDFTVVPTARGSGKPPASSKRRFFFAATILIP